MDILGESARGEDCVMSLHDLYKSRAPCGFDQDLIDK